MSRFMLMCLCLLSLWHLFVYFTAFFVCFAASGIINNNNNNNINMYLNTLKAQPAIVK